LIFINRPINKIPFVMNKKTSAFNSSSGRVTPRLSIAVVLGVSFVVLAGLAYEFFKKPDTPVEKPDPNATLAIRLGSDRLQLAPEQVKELNVGPVITQSFEIERETLGTIDFNQDETVQVFSPYSGRIAQFAVKAGDTVQAGQTLFSVDVPDLAQAGATFLASAAALKTANEALTRAKVLFESQSISQKELQQNISDQQSSEANYKAAKSSMSLFGLTSNEIEQIERQHQVQTLMPIRAPFNARVVARNGTQGQYVQPGMTNAPLTLANVQSLWLLASVPESEIGDFHLGQSVALKVQAYDHAFTGKVSFIADVSDPNTHRVVVRANIADPQHQLKPQMLATVTIKLSPSVSSPAVPTNALTRESDGTTSAWVTDDGLQFTRRRVSIGLTQHNMVQILNGLNVGEKIARDKSLFLSNLYLLTNN
jgi:membrane fusion protein, heavy metal efflux system